MDKDDYTRWYLQGFRDAARITDNYPDRPIQVAIYKRHFERWHEDRGLLGGPFNRGYFDGLTSAFGA